MAQTQRLLCLSSGARPRYKKDLLRSTCIPSGSELQFRYRANLVAPILQEQLKINALRNTNVLISYLDRNDRRTVPIIVPTRAGKLNESRRIGNWFILIFELGQFALANNIPTFNSNLRIGQRCLPDWKGGDDPTGYFCDALEKEPDGLTYTDDIESWQAVVTELSNRQDFNACRFFYFVRGVFDVSSQRQLCTSNFSWPLVSHRTYEIRIAHFTPEREHELDAIKVEDFDRLVVQGVDEHVSFVNSPRLAIDSPYDEKRVRFRTAMSSATTHSLLSFYRVDDGRASGSKNESPQSGASNQLDVSNAIPDFDIQLRIARNLLTLWGQGIMVGTLLAAQGLVLVFMNPSITDKTLAGILVALAGLTAGVVASFQLRRP